MVIIFAYIEVDVLRCNLLYIASACNDNRGAKEWLNAAVGDSEHTDFVYPCTCEIRKRETNASRLGEKSSWESMGLKS